MFDLLSHWTVILGVFLFVTWIFRDTILYWLFKEPKVLGGIVVTGCASGIGEDVVNHFAKLGYRVYAGVRQEKDLNHWRGQSNVVPMLLDITNEEHIRNAVDLVSHDLQEHNMELICLVNNAGMPLFLPFECLDTESIRKLVEVNLIGHIAVSNAFIPLLRKTRFRSTRIFHVSSVVGQMNLVTGGAYTMSKHALEAFADVQRPELAYSSNIKVVILQPGQIETPFATKNVNILKNNLLQISAEKMHYYQPLIERLESMLLGRGGVPPSEVSQVIERALISKFPRTRYRIGKEAILAPIVMFVPDRVMDYVQLFGMQLLYKRSPIFQPHHSKDE